MRDLAHRVLRYVPIARWLPRYERRWLQFDAVAGLAVWAVLMPQATTAGSRSCPRSRRG